MGLKNETFGVQAYPGLCRSQSYYSQWAYYQESVGMIVALFSKVMESKSTLGMPRAYPYQVGILSTPFKNTVDIHHVIFARIAQLHKMCEPDHISIHLRTFTYFKYFLIMDTG